jgi:hypothetical protein
MADFSADCIDPRQHEARLGTSALPGAQSIWIELAMAMRWLAG